MKVAIHQPNYLPWIGFFDKMDQVDHFVLLDTANHSKKEFINRNKVKTPQGPIWLTVPIKEKGIPIYNITIDNKQNWKWKHWRIIESNYKKSKFWSEYKDGLAGIYEKNWDKLVDLNTALILYFKSLLNIETPLTRESEYNIDFGQGNARNVNIVKHLNGDVYLSGTGAHAYNEEEEFKKNKITLLYQDFKHPKYEQNWGEFISHLSVIDMIFHCGPDTIHIIRDQRNL